MFGKKKTPKVQLETQPEVIEVPQEEIAEQPIQAVQPTQPVEESVAPMSGGPPIQPAPAQPPQTKGTARILAGESVVIDGNTYIRYIILTNRSIGEIGDEFSLD